MNDFASTKDGTKYTEINGINLQSRIFRVPIFEKVKQASVAISEKNIHHRLLGIDMVIDNKNQIKCLEVNNAGSGINGFQLSNGPLFGDLTDEVIEYCHSNINNLYKSYKF